MKNSFCFMYTAILVQVLLRSLEAANTRIQLSSSEFGFNQKNINKSSVLNHNKTVVCMLDSWSHWREEEGAFRISDIDPTLCTQIVYRNAGINNQTFQVQMRDPQLAENLGWYRQLVGLSKTHPHLKILLSVGGWTEGSFSFSKIAADYEKRTAFVESVLQILQQHKFHGLDLAWEYPGWISRGGTLQDKDNLPLLMNDLRNALGNEYLITLTVAGNNNFATQAYNVKALANSVDQFNVRAFDFAGAWHNQVKANHHSPLYAKGSGQSVENAINFYLNNGASPEKLIVGIPFYGRTFLLRDELITTVQNKGNYSVENASGLEQPISGRFGGKWVPDDLLMGYHEICYEMTNRSKADWQMYWDNMCLVPFARNNKQWVSFDNPESVEAKVSFALNNKLGGVMAWTIDTDDFKGTACKMTGYNNGDDEIQNQIVTYPLLRAINFAISIQQAQQDWSRSELDKSANGDEGSKNYNSTFKAKTDPSKRSENGEKFSSCSSLRISVNCIVWSFIAFLASL